MKFRSLAAVSAFVGAVVAVHLLMHITDKEFCLTQLTMSIYYSLVVISLCLVMGYAGQVSLGHGAFFSIGGYTAAVLTTHDLAGVRQAAWAQWLARIHMLVLKPDLYGGEVLTFTPWAAFGAAMLITVVVASLVGYPALRLKGQYLAMATLGFGLIVNKFLLGTGFTGAADGITGVPEWHLIGPLTVSGKAAARVTNYYIACRVWAGHCRRFMIARLLRMRWGSILRPTNCGPSY
ncbi:MAG: branched-chain amino acid ABC transporter permease [Candidatus Hydrogenedentes bacterium]|nr:branched-chain amino acid ABC transporter permease [Candidatus Hydrogenedentota bacterium]